MRHFRQLTMIVLLAASLSAPQPAHAVSGVNYVHLDPALTICNPDGALPCMSYAGVGESNILYVHQSKLNQEYLYHTLEVPGIPDGHLWMSASYGAKCKTGYRPDLAKIYTGSYSSSGKADVMEVSTDWQGWPVDYNPDNKTIPDHILNMLVPFDKALGSPFGGLPSQEEIIAYGEEHIDELMDGGMSEAQARGQTFVLNDALSTHGVIICEGTVFGRRYFKSTSESLPLQIVFVGLNQAAMLELEEDPLPPEPGADDLTFGVAVTQAFLSVVQDPFDSCRLRLSGAFVTNAPTEISYRFVDELGVHSQLFTTTVDHTWTSMIDHYVELPVLSPEQNDLGNLVAAKHGGGIGGKVAAPTDNEQGIYWIEVLEPHAYLSNSADYNVEPCYADLVYDGGLKTPTRQPPPPPIRNFAQR